MVFTTKRSVHRNINYEFHPNNDTTLKRTDCSKILGVHFQQQLKWDNHISELIKTCYSTIAILRKIKNMVRNHLRRRLVESLVLSRLDYCNTVVDPLTKDQQNRLQRVLKAAAALVLNRYCSSKEILSIGWLPIKERIELRLVTQCFQAVHNENIPEYMKLTFERKRLPRSCNNNGPKIIEKGHRDSFSARAVKLFNELPKNIREIENENLFRTESKKYYLEKAKVRLT